ncbi:MAG: hypothetical protein JWO98_2325 [Frankiales bacterium]|nr:hypothetical protein [Frankiales bacterium]
MSSAARAARSPLPAPEARAAALSEDEWVDEDDDVDVGAVEQDEDEAPQATSRGVVRTATWRRGRVPYLLQEVITARVEVTKAERDLAKKARAARDHGATWEEIGLATGMTRQGAAKRFG